eukprot:6214541-Pleurochrysis_carterae.AAC.3
MRNLDRPRCKSLDDVLSTTNPFKHVKFRDGMQKQCAFLWDSPKSLCAYKYAWQIWRSFEPRDDSRYQLLSGTYQAKFPCKPPGTIMAIITEGINPSQDTSCLNTTAAAICLCHIMLYMPVRLSFVRVVAPAQQSGQAGKWCSRRANGRAEEMSIRRQPLCLVAALSTEISHGKQHVCHGLLRSEIIQTTAYAVRAACFDCSLIEPRG